MSKVVEMKKVEKGVIGLKKSAICKERILNKALPVIGEGNLNAKILFIGEAPGKKESETGKPFCGASGKVLDELLGYIKLDREKVYVTNIVKDRPPKNRDPKPEEIEMYSLFLDKQIEIIKPKIIVTLGRFSMEYIMNRYGLSQERDVISKIHGKVFNTKICKQKVIVAPLYHPAVAIYNRNKIGELKKDFRKLSKYI